MPAEGLVPPDIKCGGPDRAIGVGCNSMLPWADMATDGGMSREEVLLRGVRPGLLEHPLSENPFRLVRTVAASSLVPRIPSREAGHSEMSGAARSQPALTLQAGDLVIVGSRLRKSIHVAGYAGWIAKVGLRPEVSRAVFRSTRTGTGSSRPRSRAASCGRLDAETPA
jgi:hypothetical protein